jgi:hypothetical protein
MGFNQEPPSVAYDCAECNGIFHEDNVRNLTEDNDSVAHLIVCDDCAKHYASCDVCGEACHVDDMVVSGDTLCRSCDREAVNRDLSQGCQVPTRCTASGDTP